MTQRCKNSEDGFTLLELIISITILLVILSAMSLLLAGSLTTRRRENARTDSLVATQRALNIMSRELANSGFGLNDQGIVYADTSNTRIHFRANLDNSNLTTTEIDEDLTYFYDSANEAIMRFDRNTGKSAVLASGVTALNFSYRDFVLENDGSVSIQPFASAPSANTGRIRISVTVSLDPVNGQPGGTTSLVSEVSLRNSTYLLNRY